MPGSVSQSAVSSRGAELPYSRQWIGEEEIRRVVEVLGSRWLTTGPMVERFERAVADYVGAEEAVAVSNGTAALHAAMFALGIGPGDEVILPAMTFAATANSVVFQGGTPVFADVEETTLLVDPASVAARIGPRTRAIVAVDYAGQPCDYQALGQLAQRHGLPLIADASHGLGGACGPARIGSLADASTFSFHAVKPITTGEGGMVTTNLPLVAARVRRFRNHGFDRDHRQRADAGSWQYEMVQLGYNYRLTDFQAALGLCQLGKLDDWVDRRQAIAAAYDGYLATFPGIEPLSVRPGVTHARHLYVIRVDAGECGVDRAAIYSGLRARGIGVGVHYLPVHLHEFYRRRLGTGPGLCPVAEAAYEQILSLPLFPAMDEDDVIRVIEALGEVVPGGGL